MLTRVTLRGRRKAFPALLAALALAPSPSPADDGVGLPPGVGQLDLTPYADVLEDPTRRLGIAEAASPALADRFRDADRGKHFGYTASAVWLRVRMGNSSGAPVRWILSYDYPLVERLDLYLLHSDGSSAHFLGGIGVPPAERTIAHGGNFHYIPIELGGREQVTAYLRIQTTAAASTSLSLLGQTTLTVRSRILFFMVGASLALLAFLSLLALQSYAIIGDRTQLYFFAFTLSLALYQLGESGVAAAYLWPESPRWAMVSPELGGSLAVAFGLHFTRLFLAAPRLLPRLARVSRLMAWAVPLVGASGFLSLRFANEAMSVVAVVVFLFAVVFAAASLLAGYRAARFFLVATAILFAFGLPFALTNLGLLPSNVLATGGIHLGTSLASVVFAFALADRIQIASVRARGELETAVRERTAELVQTVQALRNEAVERHRAERERAATEEQLRQSLKMEAIGRLAGGVAHDFNNILTAIGANVALAREGTPAGDPRAPLLGDAATAVERAAALTRQLLAFGRKQVIEPRPIDLNSLVENLRNMLARLIGEDVVLELHLEEGLGAVNADPNQMEQVIVNLVVNARDSMAKGGRITLSTRRVLRTGNGDGAGAPYAHLAVSDTGHGMGPEVLGRVFEPFFTTKPEGRGTGLGLATVYGIVQQHGGVIEAESTPGQGSTFRVYLPLTPGRPAVAPAEARGARQAPGLRGSETVLLVEDEPGVRQATLRILERFGYRVLPAAGGSEALQVLQAEPGPIHLLLTDVVMPGMDGRELADAVQKSRPATKVLFMSGYASGHISAREVLQDGLHFIGKPFEPEGLARKVRDLLDVDRTAAAAS